jgi:hypothetical protein
VNRNHRLAGNHSVQLVGSATSTAGRVDQGAYYMTVFGAVLTSIFPPRPTYTPAVATFVPVVRVVTLYSGTFVTVVEVSMRYIEAPLSHAHTHLRLPLKDPHQPCC